MSLRSGITVVAPDLRPLLAVEVRTKKGASPEWAADLRGEQVRHAPPAGSAAYFLVVVPDRLFLWSRAHGKDAGALPDYVADPRPLLGSVVDPARMDVGTVSRATLEMIVTAWLHALVHPRGARAAADGAWLRESGLSEAIRGGSVRVAAA